MITFTYPSADPFDHPTAPLRRIRHSLTTGLAVMYALSQFLASRYTLCRLTRETRTLLSPSLLGA